jgi:Double zinc ribbon
MRCFQCQHENPAGQKFCGECGTRLASGCPACGAANPPGQKFCGECGGPLDQGHASPRFVSPDAYTPRYLAERILTSRTALEGERKQVTVLFADIKGSLELIESSDPEQAQLLSIRCSAR